jgi:GNAT superfamily N-acetyltransferase
MIDAATAHPLPQSTATVDAYLGIAQAHAVTGAGHDALTALSQAEQLWQRLPHAAVQDASTFYGCPEADVLHTRAFVLARVGNHHDAQAAIDAALALYPVSRTLSRLQLELNRALALVISGDVTAGTQHAGTALDAAPVEALGQLVFAIAHDLLNAIPQAPPRSRTRPRVQRPSSHRPVAAPGERMMADDYHLNRLGGNELDTVFDEIAALYVVAYDEPQVPGTVGHIDEFTQRTRDQATRPGFTLITARDSAGTLAGFSFGYRFEPGQWWRDSPQPPTDILEQVKFAIIELVVREDARGQGLSRRLIQAVTEGRPEPFATLWSDPKDLARSIYDHWGWTQVSLTDTTDAHPWHVLIHLLPLLPLG